MAKKPKNTEDDDPEQTIKSLRMEILIYGFAAVKEIARLRGLRSGIMECPLCQSDLKFSIAGNGHLSAKCSTSKCINMME